MGTTAAASSAPKNNFRFVTNCCSVSVTLRRGELNCSTNFWYCSSAFTVTPCSWFLRMHKLWADYHLQVPNKVHDEASTSPPCPGSLPSFYLRLQPFLHDILARQMFCVQQLLFLLPHTASTVWMPFLLRVSGAVCALLVICDRSTVRCSSFS